MKLSAKIRLSLPHSIIIITGIESFRSSTEHDIIIDSYNSDDNISVSGSSKKINWILELPKDAESTCYYYPDGSMIEYGENSYNLFRSTINAQDLPLGGSDDDFSESYLEDLALQHCWMHGLQ